MPERSRDCARPGAWRASASLLAGQGILSRLRVLSVGLRRVGRSAASMPRGSAGPVSNKGLRRKQARRRPSPANPGPAWPANALGASYSGLSVFSASDYRPRSEQPSAALKTARWGEVATARSASIMGGLRPGAMTPLMRYVTHCKRFGATRSPGQIAFRGAGRRGGFAQLCAGIPKFTMHTRGRTVGASRAHPRGAVLLGCPAAELLETAQNRCSGQSRPV